MLCKGELSVAALDRGPEEHQAMIPSARTSRKPCFARA
jgi:hypothetical protein